MSTSPPATKVWASLHPWLPRASSPTFCSIEIPPFRASHINPSERTPIPSLLINGKTIRVEQGTTVAAAILIAGETAFRTSVTGQPRGPLCGMGICYECRVTIGGLAHARSCQIVCEDGMKVTTT